MSSGAKLNSKIEFVLAFGESEPNQLSATCSLLFLNPVIDITLKRFTPASWSSLDTRS